MRKTVFLSVFVILAVLIGGLYWFHFVAKPGIIKTAMASMPRPVAGVAVEAARAETWTPRIEAIGTFKAVPGIDVAGQVGGIIAEIGFANGADVEKGALLARIDDSTDQADLRSNVAMLKNADLAYARQKMLVVQRHRLAVQFRPGAGGARPGRRRRGSHPRADRAEKYRRAVQRAAGHP